jgi:hypothetical protein
MGADPHRRAAVALTVAPAVGWLLWALCTMPEPLGVLLAALALGTALAGRGGRWHSWTWFCAMCLTEAWAFAVAHVGTGDPAAVCALVLGTITAWCLLGPRATAGP